MAALLDCLEAGPRQACRGRLRDMVAGIGVSVYRPLTRPPCVPWLDATTTLLAPATSSYHVILAPLRRETFQRIAQRRKRLPVNCGDRRAWRAFDIRR